MKNLSHVRVSVHAVVNGQKQVENVCTIEHARNLLRDLDINPDATRNMLVVTGNLRRYCLDSTREDVSSIEVFWDGREAIAGQVKKALTA